MKTSKQIGNISTAFLKAQKAMGIPGKDSVNPYFKSKYADINAVLATCKSALNDNGISILQPTFGDYVQTILLHESGEWFMGKTRIVNAKPNDPQAQGGAITYARRYGLQSMVGMGGEDNDAEDAMERETGQEVLIDQKKDIVSSRTSGGFAGDDGGVITGEQIYRIKKLGGTVKVGMTKIEADELISELES